MASLRAVQDGRFTLDQDINTILKSWQLARASIVERRDRHAAHADEPHVRHRRWLRLPGIPSRCATTVDRADPRRRSRRPIAAQVRVGRPPMTGYKYSGGAVTIEELALTDVLGKPFPLIMREMVLGPIGMTNSTYEQPLPANRKGAGRARARSRRPARRRALARASRTCRRGSVDDADRSREVCDRGPAGARRTIDEGAVANDGAGNGDAGRCRALCRRFHDRQRGRRLVFLSRRQQRGVSLRPDRASLEGLRRRDHDQRRQRRPADRALTGKDLARGRRGICTTSHCDDRSTLGLTADQRLDVVRDLLVRREPHARLASSCI